MITSFARAHTHMVDAMPMRGGAGARAFIFACTDG